MVAEIGHYFPLVLGQITTLCGLILMLIRREEMCSSAVLIGIQSYARLYTLHFYVHAI